MKSIFSVVIGAASLTLAGASIADTAITGDYVEARTCSVYVGACHANGERVTAGREALMAWNFKQGVRNGVSLDGVNVVAVTAGSDNLAQDGASKTTVLYVDSRATEEQAKAASELIQEKYGKSLGNVAAVKRSAVEFKKADKAYTVRVPDVAYLKTTRFECSHCVMPHMLWYSPFVDLKSSIVAKASVNEFKGSPEIDTKWKRLDENSSFVGEFSF